MSIGLFASYQQQFFAGVGGLACVKCMGRLVVQNRVKVHKQASKQISNGCRDVQHTGLQVHKQERTTALSNDKVHKQGALGTFPYISSQVHGPVQKSIIQ